MGTDNNNRKTLRILNTGQVGIGVTAPYGLSMLVTVQYGLKV